MAGHKLERTAGDQLEILKYDHLAVIFSYLSVKNLFRLHLVSKSLKNMITSDPLFHLMQSSHNGATAAILIDNKQSRLQSFLLDPDAGLPPDSLHIIPTHLDSCFRCSAGGLIFYLKRDASYDSICAYNPVRRDSELIRIPSDASTRNHCTLSSLAVEFINDGTDGVTADYNYKLFYLTIDYDDDCFNFYRCHVYDSAAQVWTRDDKIYHGRDSLLFPDHNPVVHRGTVFWPSEPCWYMMSDPYVMSYEIATGAVEFLALPEPDDDDDGAVKWDDKVSVAVWEEYSWLCLVYYRRRSGRFTLWRRSSTTDHHHRHHHHHHHHHHHSWVKLFVYDEYLKTKKGRNVGTMLLCDAGKEKGMVLAFSVGEEAYLYSFRQRDLTRLTASTGSNYPAFMAYANTLRPVHGLRK